MKAITLIQPWATLIALGEKKIETRSWKTDYRGSLLIHAGQKIDTSVIHKRPFPETLNEHGLILTSDLPTGSIITKCNLVDCVRVIRTISDHGRIIQADLDNGETVTGNELEFGDYTLGRYAWILDNVLMLVEPIPVKGKLGLWDYNMEVSS